MPLNAIRYTLAALAAASLSSSGSAAIVRVKYEGVVHSVGSSTDGFNYGDRIWGEYVFDSRSRPITGDPAGTMFAAVRYLTLNVSSHFVGAANFGSINAPRSAARTEAPLVASPFRPEFYYVTNLPPLVQSSVDDIDHDGQHGLDEWDLESPGYQPDYQSLVAAAYQSMQLGFPTSSGLFAAGSTAGLALVVINGSSRQSTELTYADLPKPPPLTEAVAAFGVIYFDAANRQLSTEIGFTITRITIVPEPNWLTMALIVSLGAVTARNRRLH